MMRLLSYFVFFVLTIVAGLHLYWAMGGVWPGSDLRSLIDAVIGDPRMSRLPPVWMTMVVAGLIFAGGLFALAAHLPAVLMLRRLIKTGIAVLAFVFLARGLSGYLLAADIRAKLSEPFATYDQLIYSPLCVALGAAFAVLFFARPTPANLRR
jgi:hypothetical protein